jgi:hypothetical protein
MVTLLFGILKVVLALFAFAKLTLGLALQLANCCPAGGFPAVTVTVVFSVADDGLALPPVTVILCVAAGIGSQ